MITFFFLSFKRGLYNFSNPIYIIYSQICKLFLRSIRLQKTKTKALSLLLIRLRNKWQILLLHINSRSAWRVCDNCLTTWWFQHDFFMAAWQLSNDYLINFQWTLMVSKRVSEKRLLLSNNWYGWIQTYCIFPVKRTKICT